MSIEDSGSRSTYEFDYFTNSSWVKAELDRYRPDINIVVLDSKPVIVDFRQDVFLGAKKYIKISTRDIDFWDSEKDLLCWKAGLYTREKKSGEIELMYEDERREFYDKLKEKGIDPRTVTPVKIKVMVTDVVPAHIPDNIMEIYSLGLESVGEPPIEIRKYRTSLPEPPRVTVTDDWAYVLWRVLKGDVKIELGKPQDEKEGKWSGYAFQGEPRKKADDFFEKAWDGRTIYIKDIIEEGKSLTEQISEREKVREVVNSFKIIEDKKSREKKK